MRILSASLLAITLALPGSAAAIQRSPGWIGIGFEVKSGAQSRDDAYIAVVTEVRPGSPAAFAGIEVGDRLLTINEVRTASDFERLAERLSLRVGDRVDIRLDRDGRRVDLSLRAAERPGDFGEWAYTDIATDSMAETMFRAMDSLRVQLIASARRAPDVAPPASPRTRFVGAPPAPDPLDIPFEFFVFRGEQHDSLRLEMEVLNRRVQALQEQSQRLEQRRRARSASRAEVQSIDSQLAELGPAIAEVTRELSALSSAMAEAARVTAGLEYQLPGPPGKPGAPDAQRPATFRPLTPYLLGSNRVAGAEVVDLRPGLAEYFRVQNGVLVVDVADGTPAAIAGIQAGDVIVSLDRVGVRTIDELRLGISRAGDTLPITLVRRGSTLQVLLRRR